MGRRKLCNNKCVIILTAILKTVRILKALKPYNMPDVESASVFRWYTEKGKRTVVRPLEIDGELIVFWTSPIIQIKENNFFYGRWTKFRRQLVLNVIYRHQNFLEFILEIVVKILRDDITQVYSNIEQSECFRLKLVFKITP
jgi:hypothetical protein